MKEEKKEEEAKKKGDLRAANDKWSPSGRSLQSLRLWAGPIFSHFLWFFKKKIWLFGDGLGILGEWVYSTPIF
jgi:hypothetical protein